jgi:hypothetical protein
MCTCELGRRPERFEHLDRLQRRCLRAESIAAAPATRSKRAETNTLPSGVAGSAVALECLLERVDGVVVLVGEVALERAPLEERCTFGERQRVGEAERACVLRRRLAVCSHRRRLLAGGRRELEQGGAVPAASA